MLVMLIAAGLGYGLAYTLRNRSKTAKAIIWVAVFFAVAAVMGSLMDDPDPSAIGAKNAFGVFGALFTVGLLTLQGG